LQDVVVQLSEKLKEEGSFPQKMLLTNCTWEKFGERLADAGGRQLGLFDELVSFFFNHEYVLLPKNASLGYQGVSRLSSNVYW
jgi:hypothetical protein